jgi:hypothetical protein
VNSERDDDPQKAVPSRIRCQDTPARPATAQTGGARWGGSPGERAKLGALFDSPGTTSMTRATATWIVTTDGFVAPVVRTRQIAQSEG